MFQPSPVAATTKRTKSKPAPSRKRTANEQPAAEPPLRTEREAAWIGQFVRKSAAEILAEIETGNDHFAAFLDAVDGHDQAGLHSITIAHSRFESALRELRLAVANAKVRGELGYSDE